MLLVGIPPAISTDSQALLTLNRPGLGPIGFHGFSLWTGYIQLVRPSPADQSVPHQSYGGQSRTLCEAACTFNWRSSLAWLHYTSKADCPWWPSSCLQLEGVDHLICQLNFDPLQCTGGCELLEVTFAPWQIPMKVSHLIWTWYASLTLLLCE